VDFDQLTTGFAAAVPYNRHLGIEVVEIRDGSATTRLPSSQPLVNHLGTQHASGLFSVAEAASGAAVLPIFADNLDRVLPLATAASIKFVRSAAGAVTATAQLPEPASVLARRLEVETRLNLTVQVGLFDQRGREVAKASIDWHLRLHRR